MGKIFFLQTEIIMTEKVTLTLEKKTDIGKMTEMKFNGNVKVTVEI